MKKKGSENLLSSIFTHLLRVYIEAVLTFIIFHKNLPCDSLVTEFSSWARFFRKVLQFWLLDRVDNIKGKDSGSITLHEMFQAIMQRKESMWVRSYFCLTAFLFVFPAVWRTPHCQIVMIIKGKSW